MFHVKRLKPFIYALQNRIDIAFCILQCMELLAFCGGHFKTRFLFPAPILPIFNKELDMLLRLIWIAPVVDKVVVYSDYFPIGKPQAAYLAPRMLAASAFTLFTASSWS